MARRGLLQLDEVELVYHLEGRWQVLGEDMLPIGDMDPELPQRRGVGKKAAQGGVGTGLYHLPGAALLAHRHSLPPTCTLHGEPPSARLNPLPDDVVLVLALA